MRRKEAIMLTIKKFMFVLSLGMLLTSIDCEAASNDEGQADPGAGPAPCLPRNRGCDPGLDNPPWDPPLAPEDMPPSGPCQLDPERGMLYYGTPLDEIGDPTLARLDCHWELLHERSI
jgi:hypothetical protein